MERSRICVQNPDESNFNIFYLLLQQAPSDLKSKLHLDGLSTFAYLNGYEQSSSSSTHSFTSLDTALSNFGYSDESKSLIYGWLAAILHLGEIEFETNNGYVFAVSENSKKSLGYAAHLLNIDVDQLKNVILLHNISSAKEV